jgi:hypothetical protein
VASPRFSLRIAAGWWAALTQRALTPSRHCNAPELRPANHAAIKVHSPHTFNESCRWYPPLLLGAFKCY